MLRILDSVLNGSAPLPWGRLRHVVGWHGGNGAVVWYGGDWVYWLFVFVDGVGVHAEAEAREV